MSNGDTNGHANGGEVETRLFINGEFREASDGGKFKVINPANKQLAAEVSEATTQDVDDAVAAAQKAFPEWSAKSPTERGVYLEKLAQLVLEDAGELAKLEAICMGGPTNVFGFTVGLVVERLKICATLGWQIQGKTSLNTPGIVSMTWRQPYGVVGAIIPWNVPVLFFVWKCAAAWAAGNTVVIKSSEKAPLTSARMAHLCQKAGFPPGVVNVLSGHGTPAGGAIASHMDIRALSFTGSSKTGKLIQQAAAESNLKHVCLELGGKSPALVFDDCDIDQAVQDLQFSIGMISGQVCFASSRVYVQEGIAQKFVQKYKEMFSQFQAKDPFDATAMRGPQVDEIQYNNVMKYIDIGKKSGGKMVLGDEQVSTDGYYVPSTIFVDTPEDAQIMKEEIFGPVVNINTFKTEEEGLKKANNTEFGLYASVYTKDMDRALRVAKLFESGTICINCASPAYPSDLPVGGYKGSGQGREGLLEGLEEFLETKTVLIKTK